MWNIINKYFDKELVNLKDNYFLEHNQEIINCLENIKNYLDEIINNKIDLKELEEIWLTPSLVFIWKIEKFLNKILNNDNFFIFFELNKEINLEEITNYFEFNDFVEDIKVFEEDKIMIVKKEYNSNINKNIFLLHIEIFDHWDDTDDSKYFILLKK